MTLLMETEIQPYNSEDTAVVDFVRGLTYPPNENRQKLLCVFATPERAFGQVWKRLGEPEDTQKTVPLPFASIDRTEVAFDPSRDRQVATVRRMGSLWDRKSGETVYYEMPWPIPVTVAYQVTLWVRQLRDSDDLTLQLHLLLDKPGRGVYLQVKYPFPMDTRLVWTHLGEVRRLPVFEASDKQRVMRTAVELICDGWLVRPAREYGRVEEVQVEYTHSLDMVDPGTVLETQTITE